MTRVRETYQQRLKAVTEAKDTATQWATFLDLLWLVETSSLPATAQAALLQTVRDVMAPAPARPQGAWWDALALTDRLQALAIV